MLLVLCVDLDDDIGRKTGIETPVVGRERVETAAVALATADPEDSDVNVLFKGVNVATELADESVVVAAVAGENGDDVRANRRVGEEVDEILAGLETGEEVRALVVTDGAQDESVMPVIRSRIRIDGVRRVVVRQAQDLESMYYTIKQVLDDPETRGTLLVPLGILLMIYPLAVVSSYFDMPGVVLGLTSGLMGLYLLGRGIGLGSTLDRTVDRVRNGLYDGRVTIVTTLVAIVILLVGGINGADQLEATRAGASTPLGAIETAAAIAYGATAWFAAAGLATSFGQITDEYLAGTLEWRYLNAPIYVGSIAIVLYAASGYVLDELSLSVLAAALTSGFFLGVASTLTFAIAESRFPRDADPAS
jgi:putative membrane protein